MKELKETLDNLGAGILLIDNNHCIQWMNKRAVEWLGPQEIGKRRVCYRTLEYSKDFCEICPTGLTIDNGTPTRYELSVNTDGKSFIFEITGLPVYDIKGSISMVMEIIVDVTEKSVEKKNTDEIMAQIEKMAAIGQLAAGIAHELNTPLATISVISEELMSIMDSTDLCKGLTRDTIQDYLYDMNSEIRRCQHIIEELLNFSKRDVFQLLESDINEIVSKTIDFMCKSGIPEGVRILTDIDTAISTIKTDPIKFRQVIFNILKNAIEATSDIENGKVNISTATESGYVKVVISDNGPGIPKVQIKKVFEPFFTTKKPGKGTGLGLFVSYNIMRELRGDIKIESRLNEGTVVTLLLPINNSH